jgi:hypothetical protein
MPRVYVRKSTRGEWSQQNVLSAIEALDEGTPLSTAAKQFKVPRNTLRRHWIKRNAKRPGEAKLGKSTILSAETERALVDYTIRLAERGFGMTPKDVRSLAYEYVVMHNVPNNFDADQKLAGKDWWAGFRS